MTVEVDNGMVELEQGRVERPDDGDTVGEKTGLYISRASRQVVRYRRGSKGTTYNCRNDVEDNLGHFPRNNDLLSERQLKNRIKARAGAVTRKSRRDDKEAANVTGRKISTPVPAIDTRKDGAT